MLNAILISSLTLRKLMKSEKLHQKMVKLSKKTWQVLRKRQKRSLNYSKSLLKSSNSRRNRTSRDCFQTFKLESSTKFISMNSASPRKTMINCSFNQIFWTVQGRRNFLNSWVWTRPVLNIPCSLKRREMILMPRKFNRFAKRRVKHWQLSDH